MSVWKKHQQMSSHHFMSQGTLGKANKLWGEGPTRRSPGFYNLIYIKLT